MDGHRGEGIVTFLWLIGQPQKCGLLCEDTSRKRTARTSKVCDVVHRRWLKISQARAGC